MEIELGNFISFLLLVMNDFGLLISFFNRILGEVYKFCQFITGKVQRGRRINEQEYSVLSSLFRNQCPCPLQDDSSNAFNFQFYFFQSQIR